jgi:hypothetical protein
MNLTLTNLCTFTAHSTFEGTEAKCQRSEKLMRSHYIISTVRASTATTRIMFYVGRLAADILALLYTCNLHNYKINIRLSLSQRPTITLGIVRGLKKAPR